MGVVGSRQGGLEEHLDTLLLRDVSHDETEFWSDLFYGRFNGEDVFELVTPGRVRQLMHERDES